MAHISRRRLLKTGAAAGVLTASGLSLRAQQRGGTLRLGIAGASSSDTWDSRAHSDSFMMMAGHGAVFDCLTEVAATGELVGELAESWDASPDAAVWTFRLRKGVTFHNGKPFGADDVLASLEMHMAPDAWSAARPIVENISQMRKINDHEVQITLRAGNADFPFLLSDYHICMYPAGHIEEAIAKGIGTGLYRVETFEPGVLAVLTRVESHYKDGLAGWFDSVDLVAINDTSVRMNALMTNQVDAVNRVDVTREAQMRANPMVRIFEVTGNQHVAFPMRTNLDPYADLKVRQALKHVVDRQEMVDTVLSGHGAVANDNPIGPANQYFADDLEAKPYDPDRAAALLREAGLAGLEIDLSVSNAAFPGAVAAAQLYKSGAQAAGITINVIEEPGDAYWSDVWQHKHWCSCYWSGRATEDWMFSTAYGDGAPWNDTGWANARFQELLVQARTELDSGKRRDQYREMQELVSREGGTVIPMYANFVDAHSTKIAHSGVIGNAFQMDSARLIERWWMA